MPIGITALLVGAIMIVFGVLPPDLVAKAYAKDSVVFVFGVLAIRNGRRAYPDRKGVLLWLVPMCLVFLLFPMGDFLFTPIGIVDLCLHVSPYLLCLR